MARRSMAGLAALGAGFLLALACRAQNSESVHLEFLHRHAVPCQAIGKLEVKPDMGDVVTCEDGRVWVLLWLENEVAFVRPDDGDLYRWQPDVHRTTPSLYAAPKHAVDICEDPVARPATVDR